MKITKRILTYIVILIGLLFGGLYGYVKSTLPDYTGAYKVPGINGSIEIIRDAAAVPHIYASHQDDLAYGMGYVMAEDRLWQMDLFRRVATGRLSEIFGRKTLLADRFAKVMGFERNAEQTFAELKAEEKSYLRAFVNGINHYIDSHPDEVPVEFKVLQYHAEKFTSKEILALSLFQSYASNHNWKYEVLRASAIKELGEVKARQLVAATTFYGPYMAQPGEHDEREGQPGIRDFSEPLTQQQEKTIEPALKEKQIVNPLFTAMLAVDKQVESLIGVQSNQVHSNYWIVAGSRTASGKPIFANDYHMPFLLPSLWYQLHLVGDGIDAIGLTMPGYPTLVAGHNRQVAWGATTTGADTQDLYWEKLNPDNPDEYLYKGQYHAFEKIEEAIQYSENGEIKTEKIIVRISHHGPIINSISENISSSDTPLAFQGVKNAGAGQIAMAMNIYRVTNWQQFKQTISHVKTPVWNWGYADVNGNIGYKLNGKIPVRGKGRGLEPHNGWSGDYDWQGFIPFNELPEVYNPKNGFIVSANNEVMNDRFPHMISGSTSQLPYRAMRIESLLFSDNDQQPKKLTQEDIHAIQTDTHSEFGLRLNAQIQQAIVATGSTDNRLAAMNRHLKNWDGSTGIDSIANTLVQEFFVELMNHLFANKMSDSLYQQYLTSGKLNYVAGVVLLMLESPELEHWFDDPTTQIVEDREHTVVASLLATHQSLSQHFGDDMNNWRWGAIHKTHFKHQMGDIAPFKWLWNIDSEEVAGDISTVNPGTYLDINDKPYIAEHGASMRHIIDFGDWKNADLVITTGQSGRWLSPYYDDQAKLWHKQKNLKIPTEKAAIRAVSIGTTTFMPLQ